MRKCDCPAWVIRCNHFGGSIATLTDTRLVVPEAGCQCAPATVPFTYSSGHFSGNWDKCPHGTPGIYEPSARGQNTYRGNDRAGAEAGFEAAVAALRKDQ